jgi:hypothetical protein
MSVRALWNPEGTTIEADEGSHPRAYASPSRYDSAVSPSDAQLDNLHIGSGPDKCRCRAQG